MTNKNRVHEVLYVQFGIDRAKMTDGAGLIDDLGLDSLDTVELVMSIEEEFGIEINDDEAEQAKTVGDMVAIVERRLS